MTTLGYVITAILWLVVLVPTSRAVWQLLRSTKPADLKPKVIVRRTAKNRYVRMVSGQRARMEPELYVQITPWCWRRRA